MKRTHLVALAGMILALLHFQTLAIGSSSTQYQNLGNYHYGAWMDKGNCYITIDGHGHLTATCENGHCNIAGLGYGGDNENFDVSALVNVPGVGQASGGDTYINNVLSDVTTSIGRDASIGVTGYVNKGTYTGTFRAIIVGLGSGGGSWYDEDTNSAIY